MGGKKWKVVGVYENGDMQEKSEEMTEMIEENKEGIRLIIALALDGELSGTAKESAKYCGKMIGCYYQTYPPNIPGPALHLEDIDPSLCSHIYYDLATIGANASVESGYLYEDIKVESERIKKFNDLQKKNPDLKTIGTMAGICNVNHKLLTDRDLREKLADNVFKYVEKYGFNGMDIDHSALPKRGEHPCDKKSFVLLVKSLKEKFDKKRFILSVKVDPNKAAAKILYDIKGISRYADFINLKTFNFHGYTDEDKKNGIGHTSPMYHSSKENPEDYVVRYWITEGAPQNKLLLGTSFTGLSYSLNNPNTFRRGAPFTYRGEFGDAMPYFEFCKIIKQWSYFYDPEQKVPYIHKKNQIVAYDDVRSIEVKAKYVQDMHLGGAMVMTIDNDDSGGVCGKKFPLLKALNRLLRKKC
ncbi:acidic mammalian chitinase-like [Belonocnema kinseyi]|uniref:acidic mammalian chitinase-like n=1 Tax=Belonocnema kinseyi TaxID=2817044 RepID=UPI00143D3184|nr:acidic mammalian chitinase-like [Belonocnema kinseyi]